MSSIRAMIRGSRTNKDGKSLVLIRYFLDGKSVWFSANVKVYPKFFHSEKQESPVSKGQAGYTAMNRKIADVRKRVSEVIDDLRRDNIKPEPWLVKKNFTK